MESLPTKESKPPIRTRFLDYVAEKLIPMNFVIVNIDTPREEKEDEQVQA